MEKIQNFQTASNPQEVTSVCAVPDKKNKKRKKKKKKENEENTMPLNNTINIEEEEELGVGSSIDIDSIESVEQGKEVYSQLLMDYLAHQSVLHTIISEKESRNQLVEQELFQLGWVKPAEVPQLPPAIQINDSEDVQETKSNKNKIKLKFKRKTSSVSTSSTSIRLPDDAKVSRVINSNKDLLMHKKSKKLTNNTLSFDDFSILSVIGQGSSLSLLPSLPLFPSLPSSLLPSLSLAPFIF